MAWAQHCTQQMTLAPRHIVVIPSTAEKWQKVNKMIKIEEDSKLGPTSLLSESLESAQALRKC